MCPVKPVVPGFYILTSPFEGEARASGRIRFRSGCGMGSHPHQSFSRRLPLTLRHYRPRPESIDGLCGP